MNSREKAALLWYERLRKISDEPDNSSVYWTGFESVCGCTETNDPNKTQIDLSYDVTIFLVAKLIVSLKNRLKDIRSKENELIVAVAIPEGPYQCIAVAAVHCFAILLPMDPCAEGIERLRHMMDVVDVVLVGSDQDTARLLALTDSQPPLVYNVQDLLSSALLEYDDQQKVSGQLGRFDGSTDISLNDLVAAVVSEEERSCFVNRGPTSHMVFTSGTSGGRPKLCVSSIKSLKCYIQNKNSAHGVTETSVVLLASNLSFDPCFSDILATWTAGATLQIARRGCVFSCLEQVTHVLTTPSLWRTVPTDVVAPNLKVVALGGEQIPRHVRQLWANFGNMNLYATYGVTEACVYQTMGLVGADSRSSFVGLPFRDMCIRICDENVQESLVDVSGDSSGEIVICGIQLDELSVYYQLPEMSAKKFVNENGRVHYRTGDKGFLSSEGLHVLGRIAGEGDTVKYQGVRVDLKDMEDSLIDGRLSVVGDAIVVSVKEASDTTSVSDILAYISLTEACRKELQLDDLPLQGLLCSDPSLITLFQMRCTSKARLSPTKYVFLPNIPLTATGKRDRLALPSIDRARMMPCSAKSQALAEYGRCGSIVAAEILTCLNLTTIQQEFLTVESTFAMLGGDSLTATRVVRAIYAKHMRIRDCRHIGGATGTFDGPFAVKHFLEAENLGRYVDWLDQNGACSFADALQTESRDIRLNPTAVTDPGYAALLHATASGFSSVAIALLRCGVQPNIDRHGGRIGKTNRLERKRDFRSNPLHLACIAGMDALVEELLKHNADPKCPNASGMFPIHLAVGGSCPVGECMPLDEQKRRLICIERLLEYGSPLFMGDGSQQSVLHAAARSGNSHVLEFALKRWKANLLNWRDQWSRTPVHWAVLNGRLGALKVLLDAGCDPSPQVLKAKQVGSSVALESPLQICERVHGETDLGLAIKAELLRRIAG